MIKYVVKRILLIVPILFCVIFIVFAIMELTPGDPARIILGSKAEQAAVDALTKEMGLDRPFFVRFANYLFDIVTKLDFGESYRSHKPVFDEIFSRFPVTFKIAVLSIVSAALIGIPMGILSAVRQYSALDVISRTAATFFAAVPGFWLGMISIYVFSLKLGWLPSNGIATPESFIMPVATLSVMFAAQLLRLTRTAMLEIIRQDYIRMARAKGASERLVIWKHALKNALLPIVTSLGISFGGLLGSTVVTETLFSIPGIGAFIVTSVRMKDTPVVLAGILLLAALFCLIMLVVDLLYAAIDPRIKAKYTS